MSSYILLTHCRPPPHHTDKKENQIFLNLRTHIRKFRVEQLQRYTYMRKGFLIYVEMRKCFPIYEESVSHIWLFNCSILNFLIYEEKFLFFFISAERGMGYGFGMRNKNWFWQMSEPVLGGSSKEQNAIYLLNYLQRVGGGGWRGKDPPSSLPLSYPKQVLTLLSILVFL
jgi:hypothetical protein